MQKLNQYFIEVTDTFSGEVNYSWVRRYMVNASTVRGAVWKLSRHEGYAFRKDWDSGDTIAYKAQGACIIAFVSHEVAQQEQQYYIPL